MSIDANQYTVQSLFEQHPTFKVPKYQRGYAWDEDAIEDFILDISRCLSARLDKKSRSHFFGGVVAAKVAVQSSSHSNYEVIDGQQRLASFTMLISAAIKTAKQIAASLETKKLNKKEKEIVSYFKNIADDLSTKYLSYKYSVKLTYTQVPKLELSLADNEFFQELLNGGSPSATRDSHNKIFSAWKRINKFLEENIIASLPPDQQAERMALLLTNVLAEDCTIVFMWSDDRMEAFRIFQVLNDRGVSLTDGDLLRARTMEFLEAKEHKATQERVGELWDQILAYPPNDLDNYLRWYFASVEGVRPRSSNLADQFVERRFKCTEGEKLSTAKAKSLESEIKNIRDELAVLNDLMQAIWPYPVSKAGVTAWDKYRLDMLVTNLQHTNAMPLLLALTKMEEAQFSEAVASIERFVFRYKIVANAHIGPATSLYQQQAAAIRKNPSTYKLSTLRTAMTTLLDKYVPDDVFDGHLRALKYLKGSAGNKHLRYLLNTLEDYFSWFKNGANGQPKPKDKSVMLEFSQLTVEHVYPQNAEAKDKNTPLESIKHYLGNLTVFSPADQKFAANKLFAAKKSAFQKSKLFLNREIGENAIWDASIVKKRTDALIKMATKVFVP